MDSNWSFEIETYATGMGWSFQISRFHKGTLVSTYSQGEYQSHTEAKKAAEDFMKKFL